MIDQSRPKVAILLATYNGAKFVAEQIQSLAHNETPFTVHWIDDHSSDDTREVVRAAALRAGIELRECHQPQHLGFPDIFFELLESAEADVYLFCDQDDIWQPGKIDAAVEDLALVVAEPVFCFSDPLVFYTTEPDTHYRLSDVGHTKAPASLEISRAFLSSPAAGQSVAITRALRDVYFRHREIARAYALGHSWWLYLLAVAAGEVRFTPEAPTTLYRQHGGNFSNAFFARNQPPLAYAVSKWRLHQALRRGMARQAKGFILAAPTLPRSPKLQRLLALAPLITTIDRRQSLIMLVRLLLRRTMWPHWSNQFWLSATCLWSDVSPLPATQSDEKEQSQVALSEA